MYFKVEDDISERVQLAIPTILDRFPKSTQWDL